MAKTFPVKVLQSGGVIRVGIAVEKDHFLCKQVRVFYLDGFPQVL
jgi:hypothetical protein